MTGGTIKKAKRVTRYNNQEWILHVEPSGTEAITLLLPPTTDCAASKVRFVNGTDPLVNAVAATIPFREIVVPRLSVADAEVQEAAHATLDFVVTLDEPTSETVKVELCNTAWVGDGGRGLYAGEWPVGVCSSRAYQNGFGGDLG